ncbi:MAG: ClpXP protease specificity-enhancing factor, partial [Beggiatoa sp. IS2]
IYARENGKGMFFQPDADEGSPLSDPPPVAPKPTPPPRTKPVLKRVK